MKEQTNYEEALVHINKCILLRPYHVPFYELRSEIYLHLCDFQSSRANLRKGILYTQARASKDKQQLQTATPTLPSSGHVEEKLTSDKTAFLQYMNGIILFDQKLYADALSSMANDSTIFTTLPFQILGYAHELLARVHPCMRTMSYHCSVLCLTAMGRIEEATIIISQLIEDHPHNADLLIIRARLCYKDKKKVVLFE